MNQPQLLNHSATNIAQEIYALFQESYLIEAKLIGVHNFPPLNRSFSNIKNSRTQFLGFYINSLLAAVAETEIKDGLLDIHSFVVSPHSLEKALAADYCLLY